MSTAVTPPIIPQKKSIFEKAVLLSVDRKWPALSKTIQKDKVKVGTADQKWIHGQKDLFKDCVPLKKLFSHDSRIDDYLDARCFPFPLKKGIYLLPRDFLHEVDNALTLHVSGMQPLIDEMGEVYDNELKKAEEFLGDEFNLANYMPKAEFLSSFQFSWNYLTFDVADKLEEVSVEIAVREQQKIEDRITEGSDAIKQMMLASMQELVKFMIEKLTPGEDGKRKSFHSSIMNNLNEFFGTFETKNSLVNFEALRKVVDQAKQLTNGVAPEELKTSEDLRATMVSGFEQIKSTLDSLVTEFPVRSIKLAE